MRRTWSVVLATLLLAAGSVQAATTSRMVGTITDHQGLALPGVTVTVSSERLLGGPQVVVTDERGGFMLHFLPVGMYTVAATLDGFAPVTVEVRVALDQVASLEVAMVPARFEGEVEVTAEVPLVDTRQVGTQVVMDRDFLDGMAVGIDGREILTVLASVPGVSFPGLPIVYGSTSSDNRFLLDGLSTTDPVDGIFGIFIGRDAVEEVAVHTGGYEAEYGMGIGAVVNLVTRSGGNTFTGSLDVRYRDERFVEEGEHFDRDQQTVSLRVITGALGGPLLRDRLWFFASVENIFRQSQDEGAPVPREYDSWVWSGKLSWQAAAGHRLVLKLADDPATVEAHNSSRFITASASQAYEHGTLLGQLELGSMLSDAALLEAQVGVFREYQHWYPAAGVDTVSHFNQDTWVTSESYGSFNFKDAHRDELRASATLFADGPAGDHELKAGLDLQALEWREPLGLSGGMRAYDLIPPAGFVDVNGDGYFTQYVDTLDESLVEASGDVSSGFVQDAWRPFPRLTVKAGLRYDRSAIENRIGKQIADMTLWQPRLGLAWDVAGDARHVVRAAWGRFMDTGGLMLESGTTVEFGAWRHSTLEYWCTNTGICDVAAVERVLGPSETRVAADGTVWVLWPVGPEPSGVVYTLDQLGLGRLSSPYADQLQLAYEAQVAASTSLELTLVDKQTRDLIEDTCLENSWAWDQSVPEPSLDDPGTWTSSDCGDLEYVRANLPGLYRSYRAAILRLETRQEHAYLMASYTYARSRGNDCFGAEWEYASPAADYYPLGFVNQEGWLPDDRRHRVKLNGYLLLPFNLKLSLSSFWSSPGHVTATSTCGELAGASAEALAFYGVDPSMVQYCYTSDHVLKADYPINLEPRGGTDTRSVWQIDLQLAKSIDIKSTTLKLILAVNNLFDRELAKSYNETAFRQMEDEQGNFTWMPVGYPTSYYQPRRYEVGVRVEF